MSRGVKQRLASALPVAVAVLGVGLGAAMKRRAARRTRVEFGGRVVIDSQAPEPSLPASEGTSSAPPDSTASETDERSPALAAPAAGRAERGTTTAKIIEVLTTGGTMTAAEVALATGIGRSTISSTLSRLARTGAVTKAERGYQLPDVGLKSRTSARGGTRAKVLSALRTDDGLTAGEVATATGLARGTVSTMLSKLSKTGEVVKATRGYRLPE
jgi:DNA-binding transcriptional ArsR family regulator